MKFSKRTDWSFDTNELTRAYETFKSDGVRVLDLTVSNPTKCGIEYPAAEILKAFEKRENLDYVPSARGIERARRAVCDHYRDKGIAVDPERVFLTASTSEAYSFLFRLFADPGDKMLFPRPSYPLFHFLAEINDVELDFYPLLYKDRWEIDIETLDERSDDVRGIVLVHPNNPTGSCADAKERAALNDICRRKRVPLIVDEVFLDYPLEQEKITSFAGNDGCLTFVMGGLSKTLGMPQMKLAWIILNGPAGQVKEASQRLEMIADTFLSVNTPGQNALPDWLSVFPQVRGNILSRVRTNWETIKAKFSGQENERLLRSDGGWYAMLNLPSVKDEEAFVLDLLKTKKIFAHPGYFFDCDDDNGAHLVISLLTPTETLSEAIDLL